MSTTITLQGTDDILLKATSDDVVLKGGTIDFYKASVHHLKFSGYFQNIPSVHLTQRAEVKANSVLKRIGIYNTYDPHQIPLYWDTANVPLWIDNHYYSVGDKAQGDDDVNLYRCKSGHHSAANNRPPTGANWSYVWETRNDLDDGRKWIYIFPYS